MAAEFDKKDAAKEAGTSVKEATNAWHSARQDAALEQITTGKDNGLPNGYAIDKVIQRAQDNDKRHGDSSK